MNISIRIDLFNNNRGPCRSAMQKCCASTNHRAVFDDLAVHIQGLCRHTNHRAPFDDLAMQRAVQAHQSTNHRLLIDDLAVQRAVQEHQSPSAN